MLSHILSGCLVVILLLSINSYPLYVVVLVGCYYAGFIRK